MAPEKESDSLRDPERVAAFLRLPILSPAEAAFVLGAKESTIHNLTNANRHNGAALRSVKVGQGIQIRTADLLDWIASAPSG